MWFQSLGRDSVHSSVVRWLENIAGRTVSIPRSGFCSFKLCGGSDRWHRCVSFNPSVGILFIQARTVFSRLAGSDMFQSLGRDSVHSSRATMVPSKVSDVFQSLGRDSVHSSVVLLLDFVRPPPRFNPSVGILFIQASAVMSIAPDGTVFQSLGRDSVHSSQDS